LGEVDEGLKTDYGLIDLTPVADVIYGPEDNPELVKLLLCLLASSDSVY
jgi:hypothetical protein